MDFSLTTLLGITEGASVWINIWEVTLRVLIVLLGVNMLVIVHEWGHFIVARLCGVRCEKFYIWFDAYGFKIFSFKRGNTEYGLGWLPLGGYVKMFGQEDNPRGIQAELDRAKMRRNEQVTDLTEDEKRTQDEEIAKLESQLYAPDSYLSKNVFQRMAIISAGVFMNIVFAVVCATCAALIGTPETSAKIGYVAPGSPAWKAGLQNGDVIVGIGNDKKPIFSSILVACMDGKEIQIEVLKAGATSPVVMSITPRSNKGALTPMIGVGPASSLELADTKSGRPFKISLDNEQAMLDVEKLGGLRGGERLLSMNGIPVHSTLDYVRLSYLFIDKPIEYVFAPTIEERGGERCIDETKESVTVKLDPVHAPDIGIKLTMGEITEIQSGSIAEKVGLRARKVDETGTIIQHGDVILAVDNEPVLDPLAFPYQIFSMTGKETFVPNTKQIVFTDDVMGGRPKVSRSVVLTVNRDGKRVDVSVSLPPFASYTGLNSSNGVLACGSLGVAYEVKPIVSGVDGTTHFETNPIGGTVVGFEAQIPSPGKLASLENKEFFKTLTGKNATKVPVGTLTDVKVDWADSDITQQEIAVGVLNWFTSTLPNLINGSAVVTKVRKSDGSIVEIESLVKNSDDVFLTNRGLYFSVDVVFQRTDNIVKALAFGWTKTLESASQVFIFLKNVGKNVSARALGGPGMIVGTAYEAAGRNDGVFLLFLCLISANLAVVNFLPIPVLDGGHMVFLLYEVVTRRKPNENLQVVLSWVGFLLILALMFWVIFLDIVRYCF